MGGGHGELQTYYYILIFNHLQLEKNVCDSQQDPLE